MLYFAMPPASAMGLIFAFKAVEHIIDGDLGGHVVTQRFLPRLAQFGDSLLARGTLVSSSPAVRRG